MRQYARFDHAKVYIHQWLMNPQPNSDAVASELLCRSNGRVLSRCSKLRVRVTLLPRRYAAGPTLFGCLVRAGW